MNDNLLFYLCTFCIYVLVAQYNTIHMWVGIIIRHCCIWWYYYWLLTIGLQYLGPNHVSIDIDILIEHDQ